MADIFDDEQTIVHDGEITNSRPTTMVKSRTVDTHYPLHDQIQQQLSFPGCGRSTEFGISST
ncbi:hypothetical protein CHS0354_016570, partial [Potamilus streckersoni]